MDYEIIATLGPGSESPLIWKGMHAAGVSGFRLNTSHLSLQQLQAWLEKLEPFLSSVSPRPPLVLDLQGSKWRLGEFSPCELVSGQDIELICAASTDRKAVLPVPHADFFKAALVSSPEVVLNDARIRLRVETSGPDWMHARIVQGGSIASHQGITFLSSNFRQEGLNEKDQAILEKTCCLARIHYALSYLRDSAEAAGYRAKLGPSAYLIAKLERAPAIEDGLEIAKSVNEVWLCRGDLGAELGIRAMAEAVFQFSEKVRSFPVPVLLAGQVLEHMTMHPTPTRSEISYLYDSLARGYRGLVLSDETAVGRYPVESCRTAALFKAIPWHKPQVFVH